MQNLRTALSPATSEKLCYSGVRSPNFGFSPMLPLLLDKISFVSYYDIGVIEAIIARGETGGRHANCSTTKRGDKLYQWHCDFMSLWGKVP